MKSEIKGTQEQESKYPCLKKYSHVDGNTIVLFTSKNEGICVYTTHPHNNVGQFSKHWAEEDMTYFTGIIELSN